MILECCLRNYLSIRNEVKISFLATSLKENLPFLLADTVGFIAKLPHHLVDAFRATLEELEYAEGTGLCRQAIDDCLQQDRQLFLD